MAICEFCGAEREYLLPVHIVVSESANLINFRKITNACSLILREENQGYYQNSGNKIFSRDKKAQIN